MSLLAKFAKFFVDDAGEASCMRLTVFCTVVAVLFPWFYSVVSTGNYADIGFNSAMVILFCVFGKTAQAFIEYGPFQKNTPQVEPCAAASDGTDSPSVTSGMGNASPVPSPRNMQNACIEDVAAYMRSPRSVSLCGSRATGISVDERAYLNGPTGGPSKPVVSPTGDIS